MEYVSDSTSSVSDTRLVPMTSQLTSTRSSPSRPWSASCTTTSPRARRSRTRRQPFEDTYIVIVTAMMITFPSVPNDCRAPGTPS
jgi:hypothetical protein